MSQDSLRVKSVKHINAFAIFVEAVKAYKTCSRQNARVFQQGAQRHACPFGNSAPAFLATMPGDLRALSKLFKIVHRIFSWFGYTAFDRKNKVLKIIFFQFLVFLTVSRLACR